MRRLAATLALVLGPLALSGCSVQVGGHGHHEPVASPGPPDHAPAHGYRRKHAYRYYPDAEVYFAPDRGTWFWLEGDGWRAGVQLPEHLRLSLGGSVTVDLDTERPYEQHGRVVSDHPGKGRGRRAGAGKP